MATIGIGRMALGGRRMRRSVIVAAFVLAVVGAVTALGLVGLHTVYADRVLPGVRVGTVDLGGLDRQAARARLESAYASLAGGELELTGASTPIGVSLGPLGRRLATDPALDAALGVGRGANPVETAEATARLLLGGGPQIAPIVVVDDDALRGLVADLGDTLDLAALDAGVAPDATGFAVRAAVPGRRLDRDGLLAALRAVLSRPEPVANSIPLAFVELAPTIPTAAAERARIVADRFTARTLTLVAAGERWSAEPGLLRRWLRFSPSPSGAVSTTLDGPAVASWLDDVAAKANRPARNATFLFRDGRVRVAPATAGRVLDVPATAARIEAILAAAEDEARPASIAGVVSEAPPTLTTAEAERLAARMRRVSKWTTNFVPSERNGFGANIRVPAKAINGTVVLPGEVFDYWDAVGEVSRRTGFRQGAAIINGKTEPQGAFAGGICTSSTTMFNAAARAGYEILARRAHFYYIDRYPLGLDATVYKTDGYIQTMAFRNDTPYPLLVRGLAGTTWTSFEIWSVPTGRTVSFSRPIMKNHRAATGGVEYDPSKPAGYRKVVEVPTDGMDTWVTRTVRDRSGAVVHRDTWFSRYRRIDGLIIRGGGLA